MMSTSTTGPPFHEGDEVVLAVGTYQGTSGVFLRLREDTAWADITRARWQHPQPPGGVARPFAAPASPGAPYDGHNHRGEHLD